MRFVIFALLLATLLFAGCSSENTSAVDNAGAGEFVEFDLDDKPYVARPPFDFCECGGFSGHWVRDDIGGLTGTLNGVWITDAGDTTGYFSGSFWRDDDGVGRLDGDLSGYVTDEVWGEFTGMWVYDDYRLCPLCGSSHGFLNGTFTVLHSGDTGILEAVFGDYTIPPEENSLPLQGIWKLYCSNLEALD